VVHAFFYRLHYKIQWFFTHWLFHFINGYGFASWNWNTYNCLIHATFCSLLETTKSPVVVALELGGVQVCIGCNVILFSWLLVVFILTSHISPLCSCCSRTCCSYFSWNCPPRLYHNMVCYLDSLSIVDRFLFTTH
jgi:hypothetical protein